MGSIFEYKPILEYVLQDINSVKNIEEPALEAVRPYISSGVATITTKVDKIQTELEIAKNAIDKKLEGLLTPMDIELDDILAGKLSTYPDYSKLIDDKVLTYQLYGQIKDDPMFAAIIDEWEEYHAGIDGSLEAEMLYYIDTINNMVTNISKLIEDTVLYDKPVEIRDDAKKMREFELLAVEKYLYLQDQVRAGSKTPAELKSLMKQFETVEMELKFNKNVTSVLSITLSKLLGVVQNIQSCIADDIQAANYKLLERQVEDTSRRLSLNTAQGRAIIYSAFANQYSDVVNLKRNHKNLANDFIRNKTFKDAVIELRLFKDVAIPNLVELSSMDEDSPMGNAGMTLIAGLENITKSYKSSMLNIKNSMEADIAIMNNLVSRIYEKYKTRTMYKII